MSLVRDSLNFKGSGNSSRVCQDSMKGLWPKVQKSTKANNPNLGVINHEKSGVLVENCAE